MCTITSDDRCLVVCCGFVNSDVDCEWIVLWNGDGMKVKWLVQWLTCTKEIKYMFYYIMFGVITLQISIYWAKKHSTGLTLVPCVATLCFPTFPRIPFDILDSAVPDKKLDKLIEPRRRTVTHKTLPLCRSTEPDTYRRREKESRFFEWEHTQTWWLDIAANISAIKLSLKQKVG